MRSLVANAANTSVTIISEALRATLLLHQISDSNIEPAYYGLVGGIQRTTMTGEVYFTPDYSNIIRIKIPQSVSILNLVSVLRHLPVIFSVDIPRKINIESP